MSDPDMQTSLNEIYKALGTLSAQVEGLRKDIHDSEVLAEKNNATASTSRAAVHQRLDEVAHRTGVLEGKVDTMRRDINVVKDVTDEVTKWKQAGMGALAVTGIASSAITALLASYWSDLVRYFRG